MSRVEIVTRDGKIRMVKQKLGDFLVKIGKANYADEIPPVFSGGSSSAPDSDEGAGVLISEAVRELAEQEGIDIANVEGTGKHGRINKSDVMAYKTRMMVAARPEQSVPESEAQTYSTTDLTA